MLPDMLATPKAVRGRWKRAAPWLGVLFCAAGAASGDGFDFDTEIQPFLSTHCYECHNFDRARGDLNLERFGSTAVAAGELETWERVARRVRDGEMPPRRRPQPEDSERETLLGWIAVLEATQPDCNQLASEDSTTWYPGFVTGRRLNRAEYENTLRDLFGVPFAVARLFPSDGAGGEGFDTDGNALFLSAIQAERYLEVAEQVVDAVFAAPGRAQGFWGRALSFDWRPRTQSADLAAARERLITQYPDENTPPREAARRVVTAFTERAWRRPVTEEEVERLLTLFDGALSRGDAYEEALKPAIIAVLVSPHFLFLAEPEPPQRGEYPLGGHQLAARLSYFLWSSKPDSELRALAETGRLQEPDVLREQVRRMLRDPRSRALGDVFALQWLGITQLGETILLDAERFPEFDRHLARAMQQEVAMFFHAVASENRGLLELLDADYTFANARLAAIYEIEGVTGTGMQRVQLADNRRGGFLGMAGVLTATSQPLRTSPVLRGKWVLEQLFGDRVPPPPPDAGELPADDLLDDGLSLRERLELHRTAPDCASCHARMDPLGFGLENFDPIGRWRDEQAGLPIDSRGELPSGEIFDGPAELKQLLLERKEAFIRNLSRKMLGYALGRGLTRFDLCVVDDCVAALQADGYRAETLFTEIVLSYPFRHRYSGGLNEE